MTWLFAGIALGLFLWAFVEAYAWPVVPDVALACAVFLVPEGAAMFVTSTVAGSIIGGVTAMMAHRAGWRWPLREAQKSKSSSRGSPSSKESSRPAL